MKVIQWFSVHRWGPRFASLFLVFVMLAGVSHRVTATQPAVPAIDLIEPSVTINAALSQPDPTDQSPILFEVVFSEPVSGFDASDVTLTGGANATTAVVTGGPTTYSVAVSGMSANGTVTAYLLAGVAVDAAGNGNLISTSIDNSVTYIYNSNEAPEAVVVNGVCSSSNLASGTISLNLSDTDGDALTLELLSNSNPGLVNNANIVIGGTGNNLTISVAAVSKIGGTATLTFRLSDGTVTVPVVITVIIGTDKKDTVNGTGGVDMIFGRNGANVLNGGAGNDLLCSGNGNDILSGGTGNDFINGGNGNDTEYGGAGNDFLNGSAGNDRMTGGSGGDFFIGGSGTDTITDYNAAEGDSQDGTVP